MLLTATQLFDLASDLLKSKQHPTQTGPRGGKFYLTQSGEKIYVEEGVVGKKIKGETEPPQLLLHTTSAPHLVESKKDVEVKIVPGKKELPARFQSKMKVGHPKRSYIRAQESSNWPAYFCRNCNSAIVPNHDHPVTVQRVIRNPRTNQVEGRVGETVGNTTDVTQINPKTGEKKYIDPPDPAAVAQKLCPTCFKQHAVQSREVTGRVPALKLTVASRTKMKEVKAAAKLLEGALKKLPIKRSKEEQRSIREHEATQATQARAEAKRLKAAGLPTTVRREREAAAMNREETEAQAKIRTRFKNHLIRQGTDEATASESANKMTPVEIRQFRDQSAHEESVRGEETRQRLGKELEGKKLVRVVGMSQLMDLMERRKHGVPGSEEEHGATFEGLNPTKARQDEATRTEKLRDRQEKESKIKKSVGLWMSV